MVILTAWKVSVFGAILVRIFPYSVQMWENTDQNNSEYAHFSRSVSFGKLHPAEDWAQMLLEVLGVKINIFRDFMRLNELQCLGPTFKSWPFFKVILFREDTFNVHDP